MTKYEMNKRLLDRMSDFFRAKDICIIVFSMLINICRDILLLAIPFIAVKIYSTEKGLLFFVLFSFVLYLVHTLSTHVQMHRDNLCFSFRYMQIPELAEVVFSKNTEYIESSKGQLEIDNAYEAVFRGGTAGIGVYLLAWIRLIETIVLFIVLLCILGAWMQNMVFLAIILVGSLLLFGLQRWSFRLAMVYKQQTEKPKHEEKYLYSRCLDEVTGAEARLFPVKSFIMEKFEAVFTQMKRAYQQYQTRLLGVQIWMEIVFVGTLFLSLLCLFHYGRIESEPAIVPVMVLLGFRLLQMMRVISTEEQRIIENGPLLKDWLMFEKDESSMDGEDLDRIQSIEFDRVSYDIPGTGKRILHEISFQASSNENIAIIGMNGAGKTTLMKLLCGLIAPTEGEIRFNGEPMGKWSRDSVKKQMAVLFQDHAIFDMSVGRNLSCEDAFDPARVKKVLSWVGLDEKISKQTPSYQLHMTKVSTKDGIELSGGERERFLLSRLFYKRGTVRILDEPTSNLDVFKEREIYEILRKQSENTINFFISHRLGSTSFCNQILLMDRGRVEDIGCHEELLSRSFLYQEMYEAQTFYEKGDRR
ncbi:MAG: ABC transporter ATP-binding protein [Tissierellia bacterium]|nr:ABC transporter ATP-binding protein [Tissierellia bacterium]